MEWLAPTMCIVCGMLGCTGILSIDLRAVRRELEKRQDVLDDRPERRPEKGGDR